MLYNVPLFGDVHVTYLQNENFIFYNTHLQPVQKSICSLGALINKTNISLLHVSYNNRCENNSEISVNQK